MYRVYFKRHCKLPVNGSARKLAGSYVLGDVAVMRTDAEGNVCNDMTRKDYFRADVIVAK